MNYIGIYVHKCPICGKKFECRSDYGWKKQLGNKGDKFAWFCSYSCMREFERTKIKKPTKRQKEIMDTLKSTKNIEETARILGIKRGRVVAVRDQWEYRKEA